ncbi:unknown [Alistipes sp. CAG:53]|nr:unknown [Alistipes sp. CAG:53]
MPADAGNGRRRKRSGKIHGCGKSHDRQQSPAGRPGVSAHRRSPLSRADPDSHAILPLLHGAGRGVPHRQPQHPRPVDHRQPTPRSQFDAHRPARARPLHSPRRQMGLRRSRCAEQIRNAARSPRRRTHGYDDEGVPALPPAARRDRRPRNRNRRRCAVGSRSRPLPPPDCGDRVEHHARHFG